MRIAVCPGSFDPVTDVYKRQEQHDANIAQADRVNAELEKNSSSAAG